jgi:hypothetical protein
MLAAALPHVLDHCQEKVEGLMHDSHRKNRKLSRPKSAAKFSPGWGDPVGTSRSDFDLPAEEEDVGAILAEMEAMKTIFSASFQGGPLERALACSQLALDAWPPNPPTFEGRLTIFCLSRCLGSIRADLIPEAPGGTRWDRRIFEALAIGWMRWISTGSKEALEVIRRMDREEPEEDDREVETLSLSFWAKAIELLIMGRPKDAQKFFERATDVGAQCGTAINPSICWTYAVSFFPLPISR